MFSLPKKKKCFYKVMWVYKEKVTACWQSNMDYTGSLPESKNVHSLPPSSPPNTPPPRGNYSKYSGLKRFFSLVFKLGRWE